MPVSRDIAYCSSISFPSQYANRLQTLQTSEAMHRELATISGTLHLLANIVTHQKKLYGGKVVNFTTQRGFLLAWKQLKYMRQNNIQNIFCREHGLLFFILLYNKLFFRSRLTIMYEAHEHFTGLRFLFVLKRVNHVFCITENLRSELKIIAPVVSMSVLPDGVDLSLFDTPIDSTHVRNKYSLPEDAFIAMYVGSVDVHSWKGVDIFLDSRAKLRNPDLVYVVVGIREGSLEEWRIRYPDPRIIFIERVPFEEGSKLMRSADVLILPNRGTSVLSARYTSPLKLFEYMATGVPIVASDLPSIREILDEVSAELVESDSPEMLAKGIEEVASSPEQAKARALRARANVQEYSWTRRAVCIIETLQSIHYEV